MNCFSAFLQQNAKKRKLEDGGEEDLGGCRNILPVIHHIESSLSLMSSHCLPFTSEWHQGLCHAWWDDEEQRKAC